MSEDAKRALRNSARDLGTTSLARVPRSLTRACFICVNTNRAYRLGIGKAPLLRAIKIADLFKSFGYDVYFMANPHCISFREYIALFLERTSAHLIFAYIGQGGDPGPESLIFDDEPLPDEEFAQIIRQSRNPTQKLTLFTDFCVEGSVFQNPELFGDPTVLLSCIGSESQMEEAADVFVDHFVKEVTNRTEITNQQLLDTLRILIRRHNLGLFITARPKDVLKQVVADFNPLIERNQLIR
jgi:hypothetical protein